MTIVILSEADKILHQFTLSDDVVEVLEVARKLNNAATFPEFLENVVFDIYKSMLLQPETQVNDVVEKRKQLERELVEFVSEKVKAAKEASKG